MKVSTAKTLLIGIVAFPCWSYAQTNETTVDVTSDASSNTTTTTTTTAPPSTVTATCTKTEECATGQFCSTTSKVCEALSCKNWAAGAPLGGIKYSEEPCVGEGAEPGTSFCGWDGSCYSYTCENWYQYGPVEFTGYDVNAPVDLACADYSTGATDNMNSVVFGCRPYQPGNKAPEQKTWTYFFTQKCTATPRGSDAFTCYQNKPNTDYKQYEGEVSRLNQNTCDPEEEVFNKQPMYWYIVQAQYQRAGKDPVNYKNGREKTANSTSFDASAADKTMYAQLISPDEAPAQPVAATTGTAAPSAAFWDSGTTHMWIITILGVAAFFL